MELQTPSFILFFLLTLSVYWTAPAVLQKTILLAASIYFYFSFRPEYASLLFLLTLIVYFVARSLDSLKGLMKVIFALTVLLLVGVLGVMKYSLFFAQSFLALTGSQNTIVALEGWELVLPLGISFYTFQLVGYLVDVYQKKYPAEKNLIDFFLFVVFFPKLLAGPIERGSTLLPQLSEQKQFEYQKVVSGLQLFAWGLFKKVVVADNLRIIVDRVFLNLPEYKGLSLVLAMFFFSWQIYADFSGYTDMARGIARSFGIDLLENFRFPYFASSVRDFWRRWHISLSNWLRDYVYFSLGGSRVSTVLVYSNTLIVFVLCGLWHGASWTFVWWGIFHGVLILVERFVETVIRFPKHIEQIKIIRYVQSLYVFAMVSMGWILFRSTTLSDSWYILTNSFAGVRYFISPEYVAATISRLFQHNWFEAGLAFGGIFFLFSIELVHQKISIPQLLKKQPLMLRYLVYTISVAAILLLRNMEIAEFLYVRF